MPLDNLALRFQPNADPAAVDSVYGGVRYHSKRHAQWAVFLDSLGLVHAHRPRSFRLGRSTVYTPDFWLPELNAWLEVKSEVAATREADSWKAEQFARQHPEFRVWLSSGAPRPGEWHLEQLAGAGPVIARGLLLADTGAPHNRIWVCGSNEENSDRLVFDAIEIGTGKSEVRPRSFPADPNTDVSMRLAYGCVEHFTAETWASIGMAGRRLAADHRARGAGQHHA